jgi:hypothetical protein
MEPMKDVSGFTFQCRGTGDACANVRRAYLEVAEHGWGSVGRYFGHMGVQTAKFYDENWTKPYVRVFGGNQEPEDAKKMLSATFFTLLDVLGAKGIPGLSKSVADKATSQAAGTVANPVPGQLARVVPGNRSVTTLGRAGESDVFVVAADDIAGMNATQLSQRLAINPSEVFTVLRFPTPSSGVASPVFRYEYPAFLQGGLTRGAAREFTIPNGPIPPGAVREVIGP